MGWTLSSLTAGVGRRLGLRKPWPLPPAAISGSTDVFARGADKAISGLSPADRKALDVAFDEVGADAPVLRRALATGAHVGAVASLAGAWSTLDESQRAMIRDPVGRHTPGPVTFVGTPARQVDQTTCGPSCMALMLMMGDPFVALWLVTGRSVGAYLPLEPLVTEVVTKDVRTVEERWRSLQRELHREARRWALGPFPWPRMWGTPPWRVDNTVRFASQRFYGKLVDDRRPDEVEDFISLAAAALRDGIPVPLYVGGDSTKGIAAALPRHVVLLVARRDGGFALKTT